MRFEKSLKHNAYLFFPYAAGCSLFLVEQNIATELRIFQLSPQNRRNDRFIPNATKPFICQICYKQLSIRR